MRLNQPVYIVGAFRSAVASPFRSFKDVPVLDLGAQVLKEALKRRKIVPSSVDQVILGNVVSAGLGQNIARQVAIKSGLPHQINAFTVNNVCGAGLQSVILAAKSILTKESDLCVAGGVESATHAPKILSKKGEEQSSFVDGLFCKITDQSMGLLAESLANKNKISRQDQDSFSFFSHKRSIDAQVQGVFKDETIPVKSHNKIIKGDDRPRANLNLQNLNSLSPAFLKKGSLTAGNSSAACDGAAVIILSSRRGLKKYHLTPEAKIIGYSVVYQDPRKTFETCVLSIRQVLKNCKLTLKNIDLFEVGESFACQVIYTKRILKIPEKKLNIYGGDIALGHPLGAAGARITTTLLTGLKQNKLKYGLASICFGGGGAISLIIERAT